MALYFNVLLTSLVVVIITTLTWVKSRSRLPLPPGPLPLPLVGNVHQAPNTHPWLRYHDWAKKYGPIIHLNMLGQHIIVLSSLKAVQDLLAKRGVKYSDRPHLVMAYELAMKGFHILLRPYDDRYRLHQRMEAPLLTVSSSNAYRPIQDLEFKQLLYDLLLQGKSGREAINPHDFFQRGTTSYIYALAYGFRLRTAHDAEVVAAHCLQEEHVKFLQPGAYLVDVFPWLNKLPSFLTPWKREAEEHWLKQRKFHVGNWERGLAAPGWNFSKQMDQSRERREMSIEEAALDLGILCEAAMDTTTVTMDWFAMAWLVYGPKTGFAAKAQCLIDEVVGQERLPSFEDRPKLPYIEAIIEEVMRWRPAAPGGVPHFIRTEDTYEGCRIPAGSVVLPNAWSLARDGAFGDDPDDFLPERWLDGGNNVRKDLPSIALGWGRRVCVGQHIARNSLFIQISRLLWAFNIEAAPSQPSQMLSVDPLAATDTINSQPLPFKAVFKPRGPWVQEIIEKQCNTFDVDIMTILNQIKAESIKES